MAVVIRLKRLGTKKRPHSRIVVCESSKARDSRELATLGYYDASQNPPFVKIDRAGAARWIKHGARPSPTIKSLLKKEDSASKE